MNKRYTLDTPLNPDAMYEIDSLVPVVSFRELLEPLSWDPFRMEWNGVEYYICTSQDGGYTEVAVDMRRKILAESAWYYFDTFEEALNARVILHDPEAVLGDFIKEHERRCLESLKNKNRPR